MLGMAGLGEEGRSLSCLEEEGPVLLRAMTLPLHWQRAPVTQSRHKDAACGARARSPVGGEGRREAGRLP